MNDTHLPKEPDAAIAAARPFPQEPAAPVWRAPR
jgi:hypothetical protein